MNLLTVQDLVTRFHTSRGVVTAVDRVSLHLGDNETLGLVGESGSGKSVLARTIMGLIGPSPDVERSGSVVFNGRELTTMSRRELQSLWGGDIGMVLQDPMTSLNPVNRIGRQITETIRRHTALSRTEAKSRAVQLLRNVGIADPERRFRAYPHEMSGGMRQRVTIAIALAAEPKLLIGDEPTTALDVTIAQQILNLLDRVQAERRMGMILVTHDLGVVATRTDRIIVMYAGRIVESAPTERLFSSVRMPYTRALIDSLPQTSLPSHSRLRTIQGGPPDLSVPMTGCRFAARCPAVQDVCRSEEPPLIAADDDATHEYRCWFPVGSPEYEASVLSIGSATIGLARTEFEGTH
jgi:oligopeptide/dipeptide ABC transporter ATP-binding protein